MLLTKIVNTYIPTLLEKLTISLRRMGRLRDAEVSNKPNKLILINESLQNLLDSRNASRLYH